MTHAVKGLGAVHSVVSGCPRISHVQSIYTFKGNNFFTITYNFYVLKWILLFF